MVKKINKIKSIFFLFILTAAAAANIVRAGALEALELGISAIQVMTISDADVIRMADLACKEVDAKNKILPPTAPQTLRINKIAQALDQTLAGQPTDYKVYETKEFNAFAMPNGCIRVNSANLDKFTDDELAGVLGHEMGHVALKHSKNQNKLINMLNIALRAGGLADNSGIVAQPAFQQLILSFTNGQYSQKLELQADAFGIQMLQRHHRDPRAMITMLQKMEKLYGKGAPPGPLSYFSSHPANDVRIRHAEAVIAAGNPRAVTSAPPRR